MEPSPEFFDPAEPRLFYIAKRLKEALALEELLTGAGLEYAVEPDKYRGGIIFQTERVGAFFYALPEAEGAIRELLVEHGYRPYSNQISTS